MNTEPEAAAIERELLEALHEVDDPETGVNLVDLGLIYEARWTPADGVARILMTLTSPGCPAGGMMVDGVERRLARVAGVRAVEVDVTFDPPWTTERITAAGRMALGWA